MISLRKEFTTFMRRADVRIGLLREVVEKLQRGEAVDVEKALGTGDPNEEVEWEKGSLPREANLVVEGRNADGYNSSEGDCA